MLKGFAYPLTARGKSNIVPAPPWHYAGDALVIEYWADPARVAAMLPDGLEPDAASPGHAHGLFVDWQFTASGQEFLEPARYQYREFYILLDALYKGQPVAYCPYIFVDNDAAIARGWVQGFPKRLAAVHQTRAFAAPGLANPGLRKGSQFAGTMSSSGQRLARGTVTLEHPIDAAPDFVTRPTVNLRHFPRLTAGQHDNPAVHELVMAVFSDAAFTDGWVGTGELVLPDAVGEEVSDLGPLRCGRGYRGSIASSVDDLRVLD